MLALEPFPPARFRFLVCGWWNWRVTSPGSYTGRLLRDLGAEVIKIEPLDGDPFRQNGYGFVAWNQGKKSLALNLRQASDHSRLLRLVSEADILLTNYRPDALARLKAGRDDLFAVNPALIHCAVSAFGDHGPLSRLQGFDPVVQAFSGIMRRQGGDDEPVKPQMAATDYLAAMLGAIGILAARIAQSENPGGYQVETSLLAGALLLNYPAYEELRAGRNYIRGGRDFKGPHALNRLYQASDGWLLTVADSGGATAATAPALRFIETDLAQTPVETAIARLSDWGVGAVPAIDPWLLTSEPHYADNSLWTSLDQPGLGRLTLPTSVLGSGAENEPAPACGEHNDLVEAWEPVAV